VAGFAERDSFDGARFRFCANRDGKGLAPGGGRIKVEKRALPRASVRAAERSSQGWAFAEKPLCALCKERFQNLVSGPGPIGHRTQWRISHETLAGGAVCSELVGRRGGPGHGGLGQCFPGHLFLPSPKGVRRAGAGAGGVLSAAGGGGQSASGALLSTAT